MSDQVLLVLIAGTAAAAVAAVGYLGVRLLRRRSVVLLLAVVGAVAVLSVVAGVVATARAMFLSSHDLGVVLSVCAVSGLVALAATWWLGRHVVRGSEAVLAAARAFAEDGTYSPADAVLPSEWAALDAELASVSQRLAAAQERQRALESSRRELVAWVSHDLRTPLAGLRVMAEALEDGLAIEPARYHQQIRREVDRLTGMVDDLFELSRIQSGTLALQLDEVSLRDLVSDTLASARPLATARGLQLSGTADEDAVVRADGGELGRVLLNLVGNAIRHTEPGGTVDVTVTREAAGRVRLSVVDGCGGIAEHDIDRVFDVGWRGTEARTPAATAVGAGLGLAIARGIVEAHAGTISVANTATGCRFDVRLPLVA